jgi:hypothetical protein
MTFLLYYNVFAQAGDGLGMSAVAAGLSLTPLSAALFGFAQAAPRVRRCRGLRPMLAGASLLLAFGCLILGACQTETSRVPLMLGLFVVVVAIALPYASTPHVGLEALRGRKPQGLWCIELVPFSRRNCRRHLRRNRIGACRVFRAGAVGKFRGVRSRVVRAVAGALGLFVEYLSWRSGGRNITANPCAARRATHMGWATI